MSSANYVLILFSVSVIAIGQILFKVAATKIRIESSQNYIEMAAANLVPLLLIGTAVLLYLASTVAWVQALRTAPLSHAYFFNALAFVIVPVAGLVLFAEPIPKFFFPAMAMIVGGVVLISLR